MVLAAFLAPLAVGRGAAYSARAPHARAGSASGAHRAPRAAARMGAPRVDLDVATFLRDTWGRVPAHLPRLLRGYVPPVTPDDLAGLATDAAVESRIVAGRGCGRPGDAPYTLALGPFSDATFASPLCADGTPWTLLVQEVNAHVPAVAELLDAFRLVPNWRVDDVMVSYATTGGGVGPHVDNYDVFLLQVSGTRRWRTLSEPLSADDERATLVPDSDLRVLRGGFIADGDHVLFPGDCMYVPPRCPHWGEALSDDCVTFSIGFRAPRVSDLAAGWVEEIVRRGKLGDKFLSDDIRELPKFQHDSGRITDAAIDSAYETVLSALADSQDARDAFRGWFCEQITAPKRYRVGGDEHDLDGPAIDEGRARELVMSMLHQKDDFSSVAVRQQEGSVFAYSRTFSQSQRLQTEEVPTANLYVDGELVCSCSQTLASLITCKRVTDSTEFSRLYNESSKALASEVVDTLTTLFQKDLLYIEDDGPDSLSDERGHEDLQEAEKNNIYAKHQTP